MKQIFITAAIFLLAGCGGESADTSTDTSTTIADAPLTIDTAPSDNFDSAISRASAAINRAAELGYAWSTSDQFLADAKAAYEVGDEARSIRLADEARLHAELATIQADREATAWRDNIIGD